MSSEYTPTRGRRSPRRGDRRSSRNRGGSRPRQETPAKPQKKTLWQKIVGFFTGGDSAKKPASSRSTASTSSASTAAAKSERPARAAKQPVERPSGFRKPEVVEVTSARIYVGNLSFDASESDLFELFNGVGSVQNVEVVANKYTMKSKGFAFIQMQSVDEAKRAVAELHDKEYMGRKLVVSGAKAVDEKRPERQRQPEQ